MSSGTQTSASPFQVLPGGRRVADSFAGVHVVVARDEDQPFSVDAEVFEEDTWLALSTKTDVVRSPGHPVRVMTRVWEAEPEVLGSVVVKPGPPLRLLAVVHDLNVDPSCTEEWVESALREVFRFAAEHQLRGLKLPLLGSKHGKLAAARFMALLRRTLHRSVDGAARPPLRRLWLVRGTESGDLLLRSLGGDASP